MLGGVCTAILGSLPFLVPNNWIADDLSFFQVQLLVISAIALLMSLLGFLAPHRFRPLYIVGFSLQSLAFLGFLMLSLGAVLTLPKAPQIADGADQHTLRIVSINIRFKYVNTEPLVDFLKEADPDIILLQESGWWRWQTERLQRETGSQVPASPYPQYQYIGDLGDISIFSKFPITDRNSLTVKGHASPWDENRREIVNVTLDTPQGPLSLHAVHPTSPRDARLHYDRQAYMNALSTYLDKTAEPHVPTIVMGDWNTSAWSVHFARFLERHGLATKFPSWLPMTTRFFGPFQLRHLLGAAVDQIAVSKDIRISNVSLGPDVGSDHIPVIADFALPSKR